MQNKKAVSGIKRLGGLKLSKKRQAEISSQEEPFEGRAEPIFYLLFQEDKEKKERKKALLVDAV